jgi:hypothetical protein
VNDVAILTNELKLLLLKVKLFNGNPLFEKNMPKPVKAGCRTTMLEEFLVQVNEPVVAALNTVALVPTPNPTLIVPAQIKVLVVPPVITSVPIVKL